MTVVPLSFQLCGWIPAWWRGTAGGDDLLDLVGRQRLGDLAALRSQTRAVSAYCPELGVGVLPGPRATTEAAVAAGEAVILHGEAGSPATLLVPGDKGWRALSGGVPRPLDLDLREAGREFAQAVVQAEHALREAGTRSAAEVPRMTVRPLPPGAGPERKGLLVRAVRVWSAVAAVPPADRTPELWQLLTACARATLAAYTEPVSASALDTRRFA